MTVAGRRAVGTAETSAIGLGCAAFSLSLADQPGRAAETIRAALGAGITLLDSALVYTPAGRDNHNERLLREVLAGAGAHPPVLISTKGGHYRDGDTFPIDGRPETLRAHCEASLRSLGVERIDLYHLHWPDPQVPIEDSVGALTELQRAGKVDQIGVSNVDLAQLRRAERAGRIAAVQNRFSVFDQGSLDVVRHCERTGTAFLAYSPLGGAGGRQPPAALLAVAERHDVTPPEAALAWLLALAPVVIPIVGATRPASVLSAAAATSIGLPEDDVDALVGCADAPQPPVHPAD